MSRDFSFAYESTIEMFLAGEAMNFDVRIEYTFTPGTPERGRFGPPEHYDPGCGTDVSIASVQLSFEGKDNWFTPDAWLIDAIGSNEALIDALTEDGSEKADAAVAYALEAAFEARREARMAD